MKIFKRINDSYKHAGQFCLLMRAYKSYFYTHEKALKDPEFIGLNKNVEESIVYLVIGYGLYMIFNPFDAHRAYNFYYSETFGKPHLN